MKRTRWYFHGDKMEDGKVYCASCDGSVDGPGHFKKGWCSDPDRIKRQIKITKEALRVYKKHGYHRPRNAENIFYD
jgi:hypothetical protein